jgi:hypothetical protein
MLLLGPLAAFGAEEEPPPPPPGTGGGRVIGPNRLARTITDQAGTVTWWERGPWAGGVDDR